MVELCAHLSTIDFVAVVGKEAILEYTDHLHHAFVGTPAQITGDGYHVSPAVAGYGCGINEAEFEQFECPRGSFWKSEQGLKMLNDPWRGRKNSDRCAEHEMTCFVGVPGEQTS
jgi:L-galactonate dehydratase